MLTRLVNSTYDRLLDEDNSAPFAIVVLDADGKQLELRSHGEQRDLFTQITALTNAITYPGRNIAILSKLMPNRAGYALRIFEMNMKTWEQKPVGFLIVIHPNETTAKYWTRLAVYSHNLSTQN